MEKSNQNISFFLEVFVEFVIILFLFWGFGILAPQDVGS